MNQDTFTLEEGQVVLQWPASISPESYKDLTDWLDLMARRMKRAVTEARDENGGDVREGYVWRSGKGADSQFCFNGSLILGAQVELAFRSLKNLGPRTIRERVVFSATRPERGFSQLQPFSSSPRRR